MSEPRKQVYTVAGQIESGDLIELPGPPLAQVVRVQEIHVGRQAHEWQALHIQVRPVRPLPDESYFLIRFPHEAVTLWRKPEEESTP